jgi:hypothetical protein
MGQLASFDIGGADKPLQVRLCLKYCISCSVVLRPSPHPAYFF